MSWVNFEKDAAAEVGEKKKMFESDSNTVPYVGGVVSVIILTAGTVVPTEEYKTQFYWKTISKYCFSKLS